MLSKFLTYNHSTIHYLVFGKGTNLLICFHGYGETANRFVFLEPELSQTHTCIAIDFPFHGQTIWKEGNDFTPAQLMHLIARICEEEHFNGNTFQILAYSMGGRIGLHLFEHYPLQLSKMVLIAPDGIKVNPWYWLATQTKGGNRLFKYTMQHPQWLFTLMKWANGVHMINKSIFKFAHHYLDDTEVRNSLYQRWTTMRLFKPKISVIKKNIRTHQIPVHLLYGAFDRIIQYKNANTLTHHMEPMVKLTIIPAGHQLLQSKYAATIVQLLYH